MAATLSSRFPSRSVLQTLAADHEVLQDALYLEAKAVGGIHRYSMEAVRLQRHVPHLHDNLSIARSEGCIITRISGNTSKY